MNDNHDDKGLFSSAAALGASDNVNKVASSGASAEEIVSAHRVAAQAHKVAANDKTNSVNNPDSMSHFHSDMSTEHTAHADHIESLQKKIVEVKAKIEAIDKQVSDHAKIIEKIKAENKEIAEQKMQKVKADISNKLEKSLAKRKAAFEAKWGKR